ncbi:trihelix transcription factor GT-2-like protein [Tanacetum coccineum]
MLQPSPSRWPKAEINALIKLRTTLDTKYQESGPKGPLWEEISSAMRKLGYNRNAKRCKEKWENINKYYKKVKESSKKRPEDSKTCPYFHQLDAIYREKAGSGSNIDSNINTGFGVKPETQLAAPIMARPEQQWPHPGAGAVQEPHQHQNPYQQQQQQHQHHHQHQHQQEGKPNEPTGGERQHNDDDDEYDDDEEEDDDDDEEGGEYEIVPNKTSSMAAVE